jgi:hypothetical protein
MLIQAKNKLVRIICSHIYGLGMQTGWSGFPGIDPPGALGTLNIEREPTLSPSMIGFCGLLSPNSYRVVVWFKLHQ